MYRAKNGRYYSYKETPFQFAKRHQSKNKGMGFFSFWFWSAGLASFVWALYDYFL